MYSWLNITVSDAQGDFFDITWYENATSGNGNFVEFAKNSSILDGTYRQRSNWTNQSDTWYWWRVAVNDSNGYWANATYSFQTKNYTWSNWSDWWSATYISVTTPVVITNASTGVEETNATLHGYLYNDGNESCLVRFHYGLNLSFYSHTINQTKNENNTFTAEINSLSSGTLYYYRAVANNTNTTSYGDTLAFLTKPYEPTGFSATAHNQSSINLSWTKRPEANRTYIEYNTSSSWSRGEGTVIYNGTGESYQHTGLSMAQTYYYQSWSYTTWTYNPTLEQYSDNYDSDDSSTITYADEPYGVTISKAPNLSFYLTWVKGNNSDNTVVVYKAGSTPPSNPYDGIEAYNNTGTSVTVSGITAGNQYTFRLWSWNNTFSTFSGNSTIISSYANRLPIQSGENPANQSTGISITFFFGNITVTDPDGDLMNYTMETLYPIPIFGFNFDNDVTNGSVSIGWGVLPYNTTIYWYFNLTDGYDWSNKTYWFKTTSGNILITTNASTGVEETNATLHGYLIDGNGELTDCWFEYGLTGSYGSSTSTQSITAGETYSINIGSLQAGKKYYYRAVGNNPNATQAYGSQMTFITKPNPPGSFVLTETNDTVSITWTQTQTSDRILILRKTGSYPTDQWDGSATTVYNGTGTSYTDATVSGGTSYYYRAWMYVVGSIVWSDTYAQGIANTLPDPPYNINAVLSGSDLNITWTPGASGDKTIIRRNVGSYPATPLSGTSIYNDTGTYVVDSSVVDGGRYRAWTYKVVGSENLYSEYVDITFGGVILNCYDEETGANLTFDIFVTNEDGSETYSSNDNTNTHIISVADIPKGEDVAFQISADEYRARYIYMDIEENEWYALDMFLPNASNSQIYLITVIDQYDFPIEGVLVKTKAINPLTGTYILISQLYTDANGQINLYLIPDKVYKWELIRSGYNTVYPEYTPSSELSTHTFRMTYVGYEPEEREELFGNLEWTVEPVERYHTQNFTIWYNITSFDNQLEKYRMKIWHLNKTTYAWTLYFDVNVTGDPDGGSLSYTLPNITGEFHVSCYFKKFNFTEAEVNQEGSLIYFINFIRGLYGNPDITGIPDTIYIIIMVIIMIVVMGFLLPYMGVATGYVGIGIFGFFLALKPDLAFNTGLPGTELTAWAVLALTALVYTVALFIWSRI
jgi:hypothetical protein